MEQNGNLSSKTNTENPRTAVKSADTIGSTWKQLKIKIATLKIKSKFS
jgi:hypothetical protein